MSCHVIIIQRKIFSENIFYVNFLSTKNYYCWQQQQPHLYHIRVKKKTNVVIMLSAASLDQQKKKHPSFLIYLPKNTHTFCVRCGRCFASILMCCVVELSFQVKNVVWKLMFLPYFLLLSEKFFLKISLMTRSWCFFLAEKHWQLIYYHQKMIIFFNFGRRKLFNFGSIDWLIDNTLFPFILARKEFYLRQKLNEKNAGRKCLTRKNLRFFFLGFKMSNDVFHHHHHQHPIRL